MASLLIEASDGGESGRQGPQGQGFPRPQAFRIRTPPIILRGGSGSFFPLFVRGVGAYGRLITGNVQIMDTSDEMRRRELRRK